jgi:hypothetical protein
MSTKRIDIVHKRNHWIAEGRKHRKVAAADSKADLVEKVAKRARADAKKGKPTSVRIHKKNGHLQEERTCARSVDPRRSKG